MIVNRCMSLNGQWSIQKKPSSIGCCLSRRNTCFSIPIPHAHLLRPFLRHKPRIILIEKVSYGSIKLNLFCFKTERFVSASDINLTGNIKMRSQLNNVWDFWRSFNITVPFTTEYIPFPIVFRSFRTSFEVWETR